jgi:hypothetical protein
MDGTVTEESTIWYSVDIQIHAAGSDTVTGALVTKLKSFKLFLGFNWLQAVNPIIDWRQQEIRTDEQVTPLQMRSVINTKPDYPALYKKVFSEDGFKDIPP